MNHFIWDKFVRLTHWGVATAVLLNIFIVEEGETAHEYLGYFAVSLVILRIIWGVSFAKNEARLSALKPSISSIKSHIKEIKNHKENHTGHNPMGSLSVITIWSLIITSGFSGFLTTTDWGIDNDIDDVHEIFASLLTFMFYLHITAIIVTSIIFKRNLVLGMLWKSLSKTKK